MRNPFLIGPTIYLRPLEVEDAATIQPWFNDPEVTRTLGRLQPMNLAAEKAFIEQIGKSETGVILAIVVRANDQFIGTTSWHQLDTRNRHAAFGLSIGVKTEWGKGYGTEAARLIVRHAFQTLNVNRMWLNVYEFNAAAIRCYEKAGFRVEGRLRQSFYGEGRYWDTIVMGILRDEWQP